MNDLFDTETALLPIHVVEEEPCVLDTDLAERLGMARPTNVRRVIETNRKELEAFGSLHAARAMIEAGKGAQRETVVYHLNEEQALLVSVLSRAPRAKEVRAMLISIFVAWRRGQLTVSAIPEIGDIVSAAIAQAEMRVIAGLSHAILPVAKTIDETRTSVWSTEKRQRARDEELSNQITISRDSVQASIREALDRMSGGADPALVRRGRAETIREILRLLGIKEEHRRNGWLSGALARNAQRYYTYHGRFCAPRDMEPRSPLLFDREFRFEWWRDSGKHIYVAFIERMKETAR